MLCCISTGEFHFPKAAAADIAIDTVAEYLKKNGRIKKAVFDVFSDEDRQIYIEKFIDKKRNR